ncbi:G-protein coupled receptor 143-like [Schistocerca piceifrons]|uniref:G-protein coupled receptor 143-like n=1 Tax=Schistocerca piceifrons TaxID=274613 RepID=UPI001F5F2160|nr:G-protein coupled receptor 143-like [Schistocerca piceifrons]
MADPTIQTLCCHQQNSTDRSVAIMYEFNTNTYNSVCLFSSLIGIFGAIYQMIPRKETSLNHRWYSVSATRGRQIVVWLAVADFLASLGVFVRSALWINDRSWLQPPDTSQNVLACAVISAWIQYFYTATWIWTLCYAVDVRLVLKEREGYPVWYHTASWLIPGALTSVGLSILYSPDIKCHHLGSLTATILRILPNYIATYAPMAVVMIANPILYVSTTRDVENVIARSLSQFTSKERSLVDAIKLKYCFIILAFYLCWLPNIVNGVLLWTLWFNLPETVIVVIWYTMAVANPLQALFNSLVYRRWSSGGAREQLQMPWSQPLPTYTPSPPNLSPSASWNGLAGPGEVTPLLLSQEYLTNRSVNGNSISSTASYSASST